MIHSLTATETTYIRHMDAARVVALLCTGILFLKSWAPLVGENPLGSDLERKIATCLIITLLGISLLIVPKTKAFSSLELTAIMSILVYRAFNILYAYKYEGLGLTIIIIGVFFCYLTDDIRSDVFSCFKVIMVGSSVVGLVCYASYCLNLGIPYSFVERGNGEGWINYHICYMFCQNNGLVRFNGFFDEPGWYGTWAAFYLCADDLNIKKKDNLILLIAGVLTFSLAFIMLLIIYYVLNNLGDWKKWLWLVFLAVAYLLILPHVKTGINAIDDVINRMIITSEGIAGNNRYGSAFANLYEKTIRSNRVFFGFGAGYAETYGTSIGEGLASIKSYIVDFGIVGTIIIFVPVLISSVNKALQENNKVMLLYIVISFVSLYQRPYLFWTPYFIMFMCGISYTGNREKQSKCNIVAF